MLPSVSTGYSLCLAQQCFCNTHFIQLLSKVERERVGDLKKTVLPLSLANWSGGSKQVIK